MQHNLPGGVAGASRAMHRRESWKARRHMEGGRLGRLALWRGWLTQGCGQQNGDGFFGFFFAHNIDLRYSWIFVSFLWWAEITGRKWMISIGQGLDLVLVFFCGQGSEEGRG